MSRLRFPSFLLLALLLTSAAPVLAEAASDATCGNGRLNRGEGCDDGDTSAGDGCGSNCLTEIGWRCTGADPSVCTSVDVCGNGDVESGEACDDGNLTLGDGCQPDCKVQAGYSCTGVPSVCLPPANEPTADCGNGTVDAGEDCDGGPCCVACSFATSSRTCRTAAGGCDAPERCNGTSASCGSDLMRPVNTVCRGSSGVCDAAERCNGASPTCPADLLNTSTTVCRPAVSDACDVAETCTGASAECPTDQLLGCPDTDELDCVHPACDASGECTTSDDCAVVCRDAKFFATRATHGQDRTSVIELVLDETGILEVCGQTIDDAEDLGDLDSALEGLCVKPRGNEQRELYRALLATMFNCLLSEGGDCDEILARFTEISFSACDALCQGVAVPGGPTIDECIAQLECFNHGGQVFDGDCATGSCESDPGQLCGGDFGPCTHAGSGESVAGTSKHDEGKGGADEDDILHDDDEDAEDCVAFDDNCADARLCQNSDAEVRLCGRKLVPRNQKTCKEARNNECTIDDCH